MRVLIVALNRTLFREDIYHPCFPLGVAAVAAATRAAGHDVSCLDLCFQDDPTAAIEERVAEFSPDVVGLSVRTTLNWHYYCVPSMVRDVKTLRSCTDVPVVVGGGAFTENAAELLDAFGLDLGVLGEGEELFPMLLERLAAGRDVADLPGVISRTAHGFRRNVPKRISNLDRLPLPARDLFGDTFHRYPIHGFYAKRGLPRWIEFRSAHLIEGDGYRPRSPALVVKELESLVAEGLTDFYLVDEIANAPPEFYDTLLDAVIEAGLGESINLEMVVHPRELTGPRLDRLMRAGLKTLDLEVHSLSETLNERIGDGAALGHCARATRLLEEAGCFYHYYMFLGGPAEDMETAQETCRRLEEWAPPVVTLLDGLPLDPGSALVPRAVEEGLIKPGENLLVPHFYNPPSIMARRDEFRQMVTELFGRHPAWQWFDVDNLVYEYDDPDEVAREDLGVAGRRLPPAVGAVLEQAVAALPAVVRQFVERSIAAGAWQLADERGATSPGPDDIRAAIPRVLPRSYVSLASVPAPSGKSAAADGKEEE